MSMTSPFMRQICIDLNNLKTHSPGTPCADWPPHPPGEGGGEGKALACRTVLANRQKEPR